MTHHQESRVQLSSSEPSPPVLGGDGYARNYKLNISKLVVWKNKNPSFILVARGRKKCLDLNPNFASVLSLIKQN